MDGFERLGFDRNSLLIQAGIEESELLDPDGEVPCSAFVKLIGAPLAERRIRNLGLRLAAVTPIGAFPLLDYLIMTCDTVADGMRQLARYLHIGGNPVVVVIDDRDSPVRVTLDSPGDTFSIEFTAALAVLHLRQETEGRFSPIAVNFVHRPDDVAEFSRVLRCPVTEEAAWSGIAISPEMFRLALKRRDSILRSVLESVVAKREDTLTENRSVVSDLRRALASRVTSGDTGIQAVARHLGMTPRTLQRRLAVMNLSYNEVLDTLRREAAEQYLAGEALSVGEIAYLLGYSEPAAFHRAFRRWHGVTPAAYRKTLAA